MTREQIETALVQLQTLLNEDSSTEQDYQWWFENNPLVFQCLGYIRYIPHPRFVAPDGEVFIPDFLVQKPNQAWEIFEIKTPDAAILKNSQRRHTFLASFESYLAQCHEYAEVLDHISTREAVEQQYGISALNTRPSSILVAGMREGTNFDFSKVYSIASRRVPPISIYTYDDVHNALESYRVANFGNYDNARGASLFLHLSLLPALKTSCRSYILDFGSHPSKDRISVYIDEKRFLCMDVWDSTGREHHAHSVEPIDWQDYGKPLFFEFEVGDSESFGFISMVMGGNYQVDIRTNNIPFNISGGYIIGSDWSLAGETWMDVFEIIAYSRPLKLEEKQYLRQYIISKPPGSRVQFLDNQHMITENHPLHPNNRNDESE